MDWRGFIRVAYEAYPRRDGITVRPTYFPRVSATDITDAESQLEAVLPISLRSVLQETNGVIEMMAIDGGAWFESGWLLWSVEESVEANLRYRAKSAEAAFDRDFRQVLFFANAGTDGILFGFPVSDRVCATSVVVWFPIDDEIVAFAPSLDEFISGWVSGRLTV